MADTAGHQDNNRQIGDSDFGRIEGYLSGVFIDFSTPMGPHKVENIVMYME